MLNCRTIICFFPYLILLIATEETNKPSGWDYELSQRRSPIPGCDERNCRRAPLTHYTSLQCIPEYVSDDCCPDRYNCDHLYNRISKRHDTCYINGNQYALGVRLRFYDATLCEEDCICKDINGIADFECKTQKKCPPYQPSRPGCYQHNPIEECCPTEEICPDSTSHRDVCIVYENVKDITYLAGEYIRRPDTPEKIAICEGNRTQGRDDCTILYDEKENVIYYLPIMKDITTANMSESESIPECDETSSSRISSPIELSRWSDVHAAAGFYRNCAPVYLLNKQLGTIGLRTETWRCHMPDDHFVHKPDEKQYYEDGEWRGKDLTDDKSNHDPGKYGMYDSYMNVHGPLPSMQCAYNLLSTNCEMKISLPLYNYHMNYKACRLINPDGPVFITYNLRYRKLCKIGQMTLHIGDELSRIEHGNNSCIVCTCEVPPVPTCVLLQDEPCNKYLSCSGRDIIDGKCNP